MPYEVLYTDGSTLNNGVHGFQEARAVITDKKGNCLIDKKVGDKTNIEAEGIAILGALNYYKNNNVLKGEIRTDSKFWRDAIRNRWKLKEKRLFPLRDKIYTLVDKLQVFVMWVPREDNLAGLFIEGK